MKYKYGSRLKELRKPKDSSNTITMDELVEKFRKIGYTINKSMISRWENGHAIPDQKQIIAYAKVFNVDMNYLLGLTDVKTNLSNSFTQNLSNEIAIILENSEDEKITLLIEIIKILNDKDLDTLKFYKKLLKGE